jgi:transcriptional regulator with XRE-family HTH domain
MEEKQVSVSERIKYWRKRKELTQDALAKKADIPYTTLAKIESEVVKKPSIQTMMKIAAGLEITLDELMSDYNH